MLAPTLQRSAGTATSLPKSLITMQRPVPPHRRSTLKRSIDETEPVSTPSSPSKRGRVTFDSDIEIVSADDDDELDPLVVKEQVRRAIERHRSREDNGYDKISAVFNVPVDNRAAPSSKVLKIHLQAVLANVANLSKECSGLVDAVLFSEWVGRDDAYYTLFVRFLSNLAAAQRGYQPKIILMLVDLLGPQQTRRLQAHHPVRQPKIHRRVLLAIQHIMANVPSAPGALADRMSAKLGFEFEKAEERMTFIRSFMDLIKYVPALTSEILTNVLRELVKLDVNVQDSLDLVDDDAEEELLHHMSSSQTLVARQQNASSQIADYGTPSVTDDSDSVNDDDLEPLEETPEERQRRRLQDDIRQVDQIMDILFRYYDALISSTNLEIQGRATDELMAQFQRYILPSHHSRHPQFLLFRFCQINPVVVDRFVTLCIGILVDKRQPPVMRHTAAAYFSGFVGRGAHVAPLLVHDCLDLLCDYLNERRLIYEQAIPGPDVKRFGDFYAAFQAMLYIFCFRWRDIAASSSDLEDETDVFNQNEDERFHFPENLKDALSSAIHSPLNPLRVCAPVIVDQFAKLTYHLQFIYVYSKIETNRQVRIVTNRKTVSDLTMSDPNRDLSWMGDDGMLEGYFPYDPYQLPISKHWIQDNYVEWQGIAAEEEAEVDSEDDEDAGVMVEAEPEPSDEDDD